MWFSVICCHNNFDNQVNQHINEYSSLGGISKKVLVSTELKHDIFFSLIFVPFVYHQTSMNVAAGRARTEDCALTTEMKATRVSANLATRELTVKVVRKSLNMGICK